MVFLRLFGNSIVACTLAACLDVILVLKLYQATPHVVVDHRLIVGRHGGPDGSLDFFSSTGCQVDVEFAGQIDKIAAGVMIAGRKIVDQLGDASGAFGHQLIALALFNLFT